MRPSRNALLVEALASVLKQRRNELGLTQEDLAGSAELDRPYVTMLEAGRKQPTISVLWRLAVGLQLSAAGLAERVDDKYLQLSKIAAASARRSAPKA